MARVGDETADENAAAQTEADANANANAKADAEIKPGDGEKANVGAADEATQGLMDIAKQLVNMADSLPTIK